MNIEAMIDIAVKCGPQVTLSPLCCPTWPSEFADAYSRIKKFDRHVGLVLIRSENRWQFAEALREVLDSPEVLQNNKDEGLLGTLWGADVWYTTRIPEGIVLLMADPPHTDNTHPGSIVGIMPRDMFP